MLRQMEKKEEEGKRGKEKGAILISVLGPDSPAFFVSLCKTPYYPFKVCKQVRPFSGLQLVGSALLLIACN